MKSLSSFFLVLLLGGVLAGKLNAQDAKVGKPDIVTDRPDQTEAASLIPVGALQVETGFMVEGSKVGPYKVKDYTYNTTLIKYGINEYIEFRFIQEYVGTRGLVVNETVSRNGFSPMSIGAKIKVAEGKKYLPEIAFLGHVTLPTGSKDFNPSYISSDFRFSLEYDFTEKLSMGVNLGAQSDGESPLTTGIYTVVVGYSPFNKVGMFAEFYGFLTEKTIPQDHRFNGGITYAISNVIQYDVSAGVGLSDSATDYFLSTGISFRMFK